MILRTATMGLLIACLSCVGIAQQAGNTQDNVDATQDGGAQTQAIRGFASGGGGGLFSQSGQSSLRFKIQKATEALKKADNSSEREKAQTDLRSLLSEDYDERINNYEKYLDQLEQQLADMRVKLERRRKAKNDMIDLRIQVLEAEADDLGWPSRINLPGRFPGAAGGGGVYSTQSPFNRVTWGQNQ